MVGIFVSGSTFLCRRELGRAGGVYDYENNGYLFNFDSEKETGTVRGIIDKYFLEFRYDNRIVDEAFKARQNNIKYKRKAERREAKAKRKEEEISKHEDSKADKDFLSLCEPVKVGHHSEGRHRKLLEKSWNKMGKRVQLAEEAKEAERKADYWANKKQLTTEEKTIRKERAKNTMERAVEIFKEKYPIGSMVTSNNIYGWPYKIEKYNKKTLRLEGKDWNVDLTLCLEFKDCFDLANKELHD